MASTPQGEASIDLPQAFESILAIIFAAVIRSINYRSGRKEGDIRRKYTLARVLGSRLQGAKVILCTYQAAKPRISTGADSNDSHEGWGERRKSVRPNKGIEIAAAK